MALVLVKYKTSARVINWMNSISNSRRSWIIIDNTRTNLWRTLSAHIRGNHQGRNSRWAWKSTICLPERKHTGDIST